MKLEDLIGNNRYARKPRLVKRKSWESYVLISQISHIRREAYIPEGIEFSYGVLSTGNEYFELSYNDLCADDWQAKTKKKAVKK